MRRAILGTFLLAAGAVPASALAQPEPTGGGAEGIAPPPPEAMALSSLPIQQARLDNGLRVVLSADRTIPTVAVTIYYDVGSRNEVRGRSGFAHLFEHMMFQGSANVAKGEHFQLIMNRGGSLNGTTNHDRTNYFETLPSNELALGLWLEADRMRSLAVNAENFENQRQTVMEERRQSYENQPYMMSSLRLNELAFGDYWPYAHSTIGEVADLENAPLAAVQEFWGQHYAPNNAVVAIAGDFDPTEALAMVRRYFGSIPRRDVPAYAPEDIREQTGERTDTMIDPLAELPAFHIAYHIPETRSDDHYPLELLAIVLGDGESSRLYQKLVKERELLQSIEVSTDDRRGPDLLSVWAVVAAGRQGTAARQIIFDEITSIARRGITERELQKAKNRVRSQFIFGMQSNLSRAMHLAEFEMYWGDARLLRDELARYTSVTAATCSGSRNSTSTRRTAPCWTWCQGPRASRAPKEVPDERAREIDRALRDRVVGDRGMRKHDRGDPRGDARQR